MYCGLQIFVAINQGSTVAGDVNARVAETADMVIFITTQLLDDDDDDDDNNKPTTINTTITIDNKVGSVVTSYSLSSTHTYTESINQPINQPTSQSVNQSCTLEGHHHYGTSVSVPEPPANRLKSKARPATALVTTIAMA